MTVTRKRLFGPSQLTNASATLYTVPASTLTTIEHLHFANEAAVDAQLTMNIGSDAAGHRLFKGFVIPANSVYDYYPQRGYLNAAEIITGFTAAGSDVTVTCWGREETLG